MRKFFEGHSLTGVVVIISVSILAIFLRTFDLDSQSPWTDEIASWWYLRHLDTVFYRESHTPLFYGILRVFLGEDATITGIRQFVGAVSIIHLIEFFFLGQLALSKRAFLLFWVFLCLNPADIVHARMARHYSWLLEGMLVYFLLWKIKAPGWLKLTTGIFMCLLHVFAVIPVAVMAGYDFYRSRNKQVLIFDLSPCLFPILYYATRILVFGQDKVIENVSWVKNTTWMFFMSTITQMFGDSYPRFEFFPVSPVLAAILFIAALAPLVYFKKDSSRLFFIIFITSFVMVEILAPWTSLRVNRYLIYLSGIWLFALSESLESVKKYFYYPMLAVPFVYLVYFNPLLNFPWEREKFESWKDFSQRTNISQKMVCLNIYQSEYFGENYLPCSEQSLRMDTTQPFLFFDLNGTETYAVSRFVNALDVTEYIPLEKGGLIVRFDPKKK